VGLTLLDALHHLSILLGHHFGGTVCFGCCALFRLCRLLLSLLLELQFKLIKLALNLKDLGRDKVVLGEAVRRLLTFRFI
jgi:hypothetical protein